MARPRPWTTYYSGGPVAHSASPVNAVVNAIKRILLAEYHSADIYMNETCVASIVYNQWTSIRITIREPKYFKMAVKEQKVLLGANEAQKLVKHLEVTHSTH